MIPKIKYESKKTFEHLLFICRGTVSHREDFQDLENAKNPKGGCWEEKSAAETGYSNGGAFKTSPTTGAIHLAKGRADKGGHPAEFEVAM